MKKILIDNINGDIFKDNKKDDKGDHVKTETKDGSDNIKNNNETKNDTDEMIKKPTLRSLGLYMIGVHKLQNKLKIIEPDDKNISQDENKELMKENKMINNNNTLNTEDKNTPTERKRRSSNFTIGEKKKYQIKIIWSKVNQVMHYR